MTRWWVWIWCEIGASLLVSYFIQHTVFKLKEIVQSKCLLIMHSNSINVHQRKKLSRYHMNDIPRATRRQSITKSISYLIQIFVDILLYTSFDTLFRLIVFSSLDVGILLSSKHNTIFYEIIFQVLLATRWSPSVFDPHQVRNFALKNRYVLSFDSNT